MRFDILKETADEIMELRYFECECKFHFALDNIFLERFEYLTFICPCCGILHKIEYDESYEV